MKVYQGIDHFEKIQNAVVTAGTFDGVHIGHRTILNRLKEIANREDGESVLLTFFPHPRMVLQSDSDMKLINTIEEKTKLLEEAGIDHLIIHPFDMKFSRLSSMEFVRDLLVNKIGTKHLVIGYDHHFGRNREGSFEHLMEYGPLYGFQVEEIPAQDVDNVNVSSTKIRNALIEGDVALANEFLGKPFRISGKVIHGQKLGSSLGFPTANIQIEESYKLIPAVGVYAIQAELNSNTYKGMMNIGYRPTIEDNSKTLSIEVHLFDFNQNIYGDTIDIHLMHRIRDELKFENKDALIKALDQDKRNAIHLLA